MSRHHHRTDVPALLVAIIVVGGLAGSAASTAWAGPRAEVVWVDPVHDIAADIALADNPISKILFVNRCVGNCTITPGTNDARANTSTIASDATVITEFAHGDEIFDEVITCLREVYQPYDVQIVTEDPGDVPHHEAIMAGSSAELGYPASVGGLAPASCEPLDNVISFSFANSPLGPSVLDLCWTVAQESAHSFGLPNHVRDCSDPMTYITGCGQKFFRDTGLQCGDFAADECRCIGGQLQNSHRTLLDVFGPGQAVDPPEIEIFRPLDGASVVDGVAIQFAVEDKRAGDHVYMYVNGTLYQDREAWPFEQAGAPYLFTLPAHPDGFLNIEIRARNEVGGEGTTSIRVLKGAPCSANEQCLDGQTCVEGGCSFPPATQALGETCDNARECLTGLCSEKGGNKFCSEYCDPADAFSCRVGFECLEAQDSAICWPEDAVSDDSGGCCQVGSTNGRSMPPLSVVLLALIALGFIGRRRRQGRDESA